LWWKFAIKFLCNFYWQIYSGGFVVCYKHTKETVLPIGDFEIDWFSHTYTHASWCVLLFIVYYSWQGCFEKLLDRHQHLAEFTLGFCIANAILEVRLATDAVLKCLQVKGHVSVLQLDFCKKLVLNNFLGSEVYGFTILTASPFNIKYTLLGFDHCLLQVLSRLFSCKALYILWHIERRQGYRVV